MADLACPIGDRRTETEFLVKLFVVHFTTVAAYLHLPSLRKERLLTIRPLIYIIAPFTILIHHALAILIGFCLLIFQCLMGKRMPDWHNDMVRSLRWLIGVIPEGEEDYEALNQNLPRQKTSEKIEKHAKRIGQVVVALAFITQCSATIFLYQRRRNHAPHSITRVDQYVFELASAGLLVGFLTLCTVLKLPVFTAPHSGQHPLSNFERTVLLLGDRREPSSGPRPAEKAKTTEHVFLRYTYNASLCFYVVLAEGKLAVVQTAKTSWNEKSLLEAPTGGFCSIE